MDISLREHWFDNGGIRLYATFAGDGPPLVLLHGGLANHLACWQFAGPLTARFRVITPDLRGAGRSHFAGPLSWDLIPSDIPALLYYYSIYLLVHNEAVRHNEPRLPEDQIVPLAKALIGGWRHLLPLGALIWLLVAGYTPVYVAAGATAAGVASVAASTGCPAGRDSGSSVVGSSTISPVLRSAVNSSTARPNIESVIGSAGCTLGAVAALFIPRKSRAAAAPVEAVEPELVAEAA